MVEEKKLSEVKPFKFKQFTIEQDHCAMKVGTDGVLLGAWAEVTDDTRQILDIGTGTGLIALMLAQRAKNAQVTAVEIDAAAYLQGKNNMENAIFADQMTSIHASIQDFARNSTQKFDLIVSNPPFFTGGTFSNNQDKNNVRHTVKLPHTDLLHATKKLLHTEGRFCVILPKIEGLRLMELARVYGLYCTMKTEVQSRPDKDIERLLLQFELQEKPLIINSLLIQKDDQRHNYTEQYIQLTKDFYTIF